MQRDGNRGRTETIMDDMDDERDDEFMDSMPEPTQSHAQLLELRKRFVTYLARLDEQIRRAAIKEEMDRVTTETDRTGIDWLEEHVAQVEEPLTAIAYPRGNTWTHRDVNADSAPLTDSTVTSNKLVRGRRGAKRNL